MICFYQAMIHRWWHKFIRKRTKPIPEDVAVLWKRRLSVAYGLLAWNAFGVLLYSAYHGKADWAHYYGLKSDEEKAKRPGTLSFGVLETRQNPIVVVTKRQL